MSDPKSRKTPKADAPPKEEAFELWLKRGLHSIYDKVASEPIPEEWLKLIEEDREK